MNKGRWEGSDREEDEEEEGEGEEGGDVDEDVSRFI